MFRNTAMAVLTVCLSLLLISTAVGCTSSTNSDNGNDNAPNNGRMMNGDGSSNGSGGGSNDTTGTEGSRGTNGMMNGDGSSTDN